MKNSSTAEKRSTVLNTAKKLKTRLPKNSKNCMKQTKRSKTKTSNYRSKWNTS